jgi:hypothetical protein
MMFSIHELWEGRGEKGRTVYLIKYAGRWGRREWRIPKTRWRYIEIDCDVCGSYEVRKDMTYQHKNWYCPDCAPLPR